jgi:hypothetical protein
MKMEGKRYIWRTVGDGKVRSSHAEREGEVFSWDNPPDGGHPGEAPNCRCWAEAKDHCLDERDKSAEAQKEFEDARHELEENERLIHNLKLEIPVLKYDLSVLENKALAYGVGSQLSRFPSPWTKIGGAAASAEATALRVKISEKTFEMKSKIAELQTLEKGLRALIRKVKLLEAGFETAREAYNECKKMMGVRK